MGFPKGLSICYVLLSILVVVLGSINLDSSRDNLVIPNCHCDHNTTANNVSLVNVTTPVESTTNTSMPGNDTESTVQPTIEVGLGNITEATTNSTIEVGLGNITEPTTNSTTDANVGNTTVYEMCVDDVIDPALGQFTIRSHGFGHVGYGPFERCPITFSPDSPRVLRMTFDTFDLEAGATVGMFGCRRDKLFVNYAILCGTWPTNRTMDFLAKPSSPFTFNFRSDQSVTTSGFSIRVEVREYERGEVVREYNGVGSYPWNSYYEARCGPECYSQQD